MSSRAFEFESTVEPFDSGYDFDLVPMLEHVYAPELEVVLQLEDAVERDADDLDDDWFAFDDTQPIDFIDDEPTTPWRRFSSWVRNFKRAA